MRPNQPIVITRPIAQAAPLAQRLQTLGYTVELFPLLEIEALPAGSQMAQDFESALQTLNDFAVVAFVSPNAIHAVFDSGLQWPQHIALAVVGEGSKAALAEYGITPESYTIYCPTHPLRQDSETLLQEIDFQALKGKKVLIVRAESGRELLSEALENHGILVQKVVAYRRLAPVLTEAKATQLARLLNIPAIWIISSSEALRTLHNLTQQALGDIFVVEMQQINLLVSHQRIAETAQHLHFKRTRLIGSGEQNLLQALQSSL